MKCLRKVRRTSTAAQCFLVLSIVLQSCTSDVPEETRRAVNDLEQLPFSDIVADMDVSNSARLLITGDECQSGAVTGFDCVIDPPMKPVGEIRSLSIAGRDVVLLSSQLDDGGFETRDFGRIQLLFTLTGRPPSILASRTQISEIEAWLSRPPTEEELRPVREREAARERAAEERRLSGERTAFSRQISAQINSTLMIPPGTPPGVECSVLIPAATNGRIEDFSVSGCGDYPEFELAIRRAIRSMSLPPRPGDPALADVPTEVLIRSPDR